MTAEGIIDTFSLIYCLELGASPMTPTKVEAKCKDAVAKSLSKFSASNGKCFQHCVTNEFKKEDRGGKLHDRQPLDAATVTCVSKAAGKTATAIDKACSNAMANPVCYTGFATTGAGWTSQVEAAVDGQLPAEFCGA